ncbi:hypothetical protein HUU40_00260 [candidate division KSB1 bacterium]|nr:hypothetical protein [candidate division KSB1 bacterium]
MNLSLQFNPELFRDPNRFCVYVHGLPEMPVAWVGFCRVADVLISPDAYASQAWRDTALTAPLISLTVTDVCETEGEAMRAALRLVRMYQPPINLRSGPVSSRSGRKVMCLETGVTYDTAAAAARANGLFESQLSVYLNRRSTGKIRGLTFKRV